MNIMNKSQFFFVWNGQGELQPSYQDAMSNQAKKNVIYYYYYIIFLTRRLILHPDLSPFLRFKLFPSHAIAWKPARNSEVFFLHMASFWSFSFERKHIIIYKWIFRNFENQTKIESSFSVGFLLLVVFLPKTGDQGNVSTLISMNSRHSFAFLCARQTNRQTAERARSVFLMKMLTLLPSNVVYCVTVEALETIFGSLKRMGMLCQLVSHKNDCCTHMKIANIIC